MSIPDGDPATGDSVCAPFIGYVDGLHPKRLIDPSYKGRKYRAERPQS